VKKGEEAQVTKKSRVLENFSALQRTKPDFSHIDAMGRELYENPSDRAVAILFGTLTERNLESLLKKSFRDDLNSDDRSALFGFDGAVGTFSSKIFLAYGLKILGPKTRRELDLIRHLRNGFAHSPIPLEFTTSEVRAVCNEFKLVEHWSAAIPRRYLSRVPADGGQGALDITHPKNQIHNDLSSSVLSHAGQARWLPGG
jgi:hypothetical protein